MPLAGSLATASAAQAAEHVTAQDRAATHGYLVAELAYGQAQAAAVPASQAAVEALGGTLRGECPGVLAGAPGAVSFGFGTATPIPSPRVQGEENRQRRQRGDLRNELQAAFRQAQLQPVRQAAVAFAATVKSLRWSNPALTLIEHEVAAEREQQAQEAPLNVCADMRAWARSGYKTLSPATKTFAEHPAALGLLRLIRRDPGLLQDATLRPYESKQDKSLRRERLRLELRQFGAQKSLDAITEQVRDALGAAEPELEPSGPAKDSIVIRKGRTAAGTSYTLRVEPAPARTSEPQSGCVGLAVEAMHPSGGGGTTITGSGGSCLSKTHPGPPEVGCEDGDVTVQVQTPPRVRSVRLVLSNGRRITSTVTAVPRRLGVRGGIYYQAVRGPAPIPVALTELDAHGVALRTIKLRKVVECTSNPLHRVVTRTIVSASVPGGPPFSITGQRTRFEGRGSFNLDVELEGTAGGESGSSSSGLIAVGGVGAGSRRPSRFSSRSKLAVSHTNSRSSTGC